jgi:hypothetical protein
MEDDILSLMEQYPNILDPISDPKASERTIVEAWQKIHPAPEIDEVEYNSDKRFYQKFYTNILGHENTPSYISNVIWESPIFLRYAFLGSIKITPEVIERVSEVGSEAWKNRASFLANPRLTSELIDRMFEQELSYSDDGIDIDFQTWTAFARHYNTSEQVHLKIAQSNQAYMLDVLSNNPHSSARVISAVWENYLLNRVGTQYLEGALAAHRSAPEEVLNALVSSWTDDHSKPVARNILQNPASSKRIIKRVMENLTPSEITLSIYLFDHKELSGQELYEFVERFSDNPEVYESAIHSCIRSEEGTSKVVDYFIATHLDGEHVPEEWALQVMGWKEMK